MRIVYIANGNGLSPHLGGSMVRSASVARELQHRGNEVLLVTTSGGRAAWSGLGFDGEAIEVPCSIGRHFERGNFDRAMAYGVSAIIGAHIAAKLSNYEIVYTDSDYPCDVIPASSLRRSNDNVRWVAMIHHLLGVRHENGVYLSEVLGKLKRAVQRWAHRTIARDADAVFLYDSEAGRAIASELEILGFSRGRVVFVNNGFSAEGLREIPASPQRYDAVLIGGLRPGKGAGEVVPIWRRVIGARPNTTLGIVGPMPAGAERSFEREIQVAGLDGTIDVLGPRSHNETIALLKAAGLLFAPSLEEGWGIAVCEALACEKPVVAYDLPVYRTLFPAGVVPIAMGDHEEFAMGVVRILSNRLERESLATGGKNAVARFEWGRIAEDDLAAFHEIIHPGYGDGA